MPGQSGPGSDGNKEVLSIPQSSSITGTSPSDCLVSYPGHSLGGSYSSAEKQSVYSTAPADWAKERAMKRGDSQQKGAGQRTGQSTEVRKTAARTCGLRLS